MLASRVAYVRWVAKLHGVEIFSDRIEGERTHGGWATIRERAAARRCRRMRTPRLPPAASHYANASTYSLVT